MSENKEIKDDKFSAIEQTLSRTELFIEKNQKLLSGIVIGVIVVVGSYLLYQRYVHQPKERAAQAAMFMAEKYFEKDSLNLALKGDGKYMGFLAIIDEYGSTKAGNLAHFYTGIIYLNQGKFDDAITQLKKFSADDIILSSEALGAIGDANMELKKTDEAISYYKKAAENNNNRFTTPIFLMKEASALEDQGKNDEAIAIYERIQTEFAMVRSGNYSRLADEAEKMIARLKAKTGK